MPTRCNCVNDLQEYEGFRGMWAKGPRLRMPIWSEGPASILHVSPSLSPLTQTQKCQHSGKKTSLKPVQTKIIINLPERIKLWLERMLPNKHCYQCVMQGMKISSKCYWESVILNRIAFYTKDIKAVQRHILPAKMSSCPKPLLKFWKCLPK